MRRPLVLVGFTYLLTLAVAVFIGSKISFVLFFGCLALFAGSLIPRRLRSAKVFPVALLTAATAFASFAAYSYAVVEPPRALDGMDAVVDGTICELPYSQYGRWYYVVKLDSVSVPDAPQRFKIRLSAQCSLNVEPYSRIHAKIHLMRPQGGEGYSSESYYESRGIRMFAYLYEYEPVAIDPPTAKPPYYYALLLRRNMISSVEAAYLPQDENGLTLAMLLGDKTALPAQAAEDFRVAGVSHLLAVSGLHMATIVQLMLFLFGLMRISKRRMAPFAAAGILCFMAITGFVPSVVRSGAMCLLLLAAPLFSRHADSLNSLGVAALLLCVPNPYAAADVGLLLSFCATLGLILFVRPIRVWLNDRFDRFPRFGPLMRGVNGILATSASATVFTLPVLIVFFHSVSFIAPLSNLLMLVPASLMVAVSAVGAVVGLFAPQSFLLLPFTLVGGLLAKYEIFCAAQLAKIPFASISVSYGFMSVWLAASILLFSVAFVLRGGKRLAATAGLLSGIILCTGIFSYRILSGGVTRIAALDVGTGLSVAVTRKDQSIVYGCDGYNSNRISEYLTGRNMTRLSELCLLTLTRDEKINSAAIAEKFSPTVLSAPVDGLYDGYVRKAAVSCRSVSWLADLPSSQTVCGIQVERKDCGGCEAIRITADNVSVVILPSGADESYLPDSFLKPDFLITDSVPSRDSILTPACLVLSMDDQDLRRVPEWKKGPLLWTGGCGNIVLEIKGDRTLSVRREC